MREYKLTETEEKFAEIIWNNEPLKSSELVMICEKVLKWKKSTTYTMLKNVCKKNVFQNKKTIVSSKISKKEYYGGQSIRFVDDTFGGSLPKFLTAFIGVKKLDKNQLKELKTLIDHFEEEA